MGMVMSEPRDFTDTYPSAPAPLYPAPAVDAANSLLRAAQDAGRILHTPLAEEVLRTRRTLRALDVAAAVLKGIVVLAVALVVVLLIGRGMA